MRYTEVTFLLEKMDPFKDLLIYELGEGEYDSFVDTADGVKAYVPTEHYDATFVEQVIEGLGCTVSYEAVEMPDKNWNEEWEKGHKWVMVEGEKTVYVRAPFHPHQEADYEVVIEPKMSFGTAHHATTYMMLSYLAELPMEGKRVLDMGCGTAVLGILAKMRGAAYVEGIDVDEWAYRNAQENAERNGVEIDCRLGDANTLEDGQHEPFDLVIANINRNILIHDMEHYVRAMKMGAEILFSGFYESDVEVLEQHAGKLGLSLEEKKSREGWCALRFVKKN